MVRALELCLAALQDADQVDHRMLTRKQTLQRGVIVDIRLHHFTGRQQNQVLGAVTPPRRHDHAAAARNERVDDVAADEAGAAKDEDVAVAHG